MCWVKIQESKMLKFSKLTIFIFSESNLQEEAPYLLRPPPYIGVGICYGPPWLYRFIVLYCTTVLSYKDLFFLALSLFLRSKVSSYTLLGQVTMSNIHMY